MGFSRIFQCHVSFQGCIKQPVVVGPALPIFKAAEVGLPQVLARERVAGDCNSAPDKDNLSYGGDRHVMSI